MADTHQAGIAGRRWERIAQVAFVMACVTLSMIAVLQYVQNRSAPPGPPMAAAREGAPTNLRLGEPWDHTPDVKTLLVHISSTCPHCQRSVGFYGRLLAAAAASGGHWRVRFTTVEKKETIDQFLVSNGLSAGMVVGVPGGLPTGQTPLIALVDPAGKVSKTWLGRFNEEQERKLISMVRTAPE